MKRLIMAALIAGFAPLAVSAAPTVKLYNGYGTGPGGEFDVDVVTGPLSYQWNVANGLKNAIGEFGTFCIEKNANIAFGTLYTATISDQAQLGGNNTSLGDPIDPRTAYLYTQYASGTLSLYPYLTPAARETSGADLQQVLWFLENELKIGGVYAYVPNAANAALAGFSAQAMAWFTEADAAGWLDIGNVRALNLWDLDTGAEKQSQLILIPVPAAVVLGGLGIGLIGWWMRKSS